MTKPPSRRLSKRRRQQTKKLELRPEGTRAQIFVQTFYLGKGLLAVPEEITSRKNEKIRSAAKLLASASYRRETGLFAVEGARLCADAALSGVPVRRLFYTEQAQEKYRSYLDVVREKAQESFVLSPHVAQLLTETKSPQGIVCVCEERPFQDVSSILAGGHCLLLENLQDPSNLGSILRTAEALGAGGILLAGNCCDIFSSKSLRASMGAVFRIPFSVVADGPSALFKAAQKGYQTLAAVPDAAATPVTVLSFETPAVLAIGNEGNGLTDETASACTCAVTIPMRGRAESLNASSAAAILLWEMMRTGGAAYV